MTNQELAQGGPAYAFFAAPERLMQQVYDYADDIYAIGGVLHCAMGLMQCPYYGTREERSRATREDVGERILSGTRKPLPQVIFSCGDLLPWIIDRMRADRRLHSRAARCFGDDDGTRSK